MSLHGAGAGRAAFRLLFLVVAVAMPVLGPVLPSAGRAQTADAEGAGPQTKMRELNRQAIADYSAEDYESAQLGLREAIAIGQRSGMAGSPLMARLHANLGAVYVNGLKDTGRGTRALKAALAVDPDIKLTDTLVTPELRELFSRLQAAVTRPGATGRAAPPPPPAEPASPSAVPVPAPPPRQPAPPPTAPTASESPPAAAPSAQPPARPPRPQADPPTKESAATQAKVAATGRRGAAEEPDLPARVPQPLYCPTPDEAPPSEKITLHCVLQPEVSANKVLLYYRAPGALRFTPASTVRSPKGWYRGVIPADVVQGRSLHFYVEARDATNEVVGHAGRDDSPNVVLIREGASPVATGLFAGVRFRRRPGSAEARAAADEDPLEAAARDRELERAAMGVRRRRDGAVYLGVGVGSGYGFHLEQRLEFYQDAIINRGWIPSGLVHLTPEVGYQFGPHFALSVLARLQIISQSGSGDMRVGNPARGAFALLARPQLLLGRRNLQVNLSGYLGGGDGFRLTIPPQPPKFRRNDAVRGGPLVGGAGVGLLFHLTPHLALAADARTLVGYPHFATVIDYGLTLQIGF
jgi:hypothetical protein